MKKEETIYDLFKEQPAACRLPLPHKELNPDVPEYIKRALLVDPAPFYERLRYSFNPFTRYNFVRFDVMFPDLNDGKCICGCGNELKKNQKKWYSADCQRFAMAAWNIVSCRQPDIINFYLSKYYDKLVCAECGEPFKDLDHIIPCKDGGGGSWLSNYQLLCESCHAKKTAIENNWKKSKHFNNGKQ